MFGELTLDIFEQKLLTKMSVTRVTKFV